MALAKMVIGIWRQVDEPILEGGIVRTCSCLEKRTDRKCSWIRYGDGMNKREVKETGVGGCWTCPVL